MKTSMVRVLKSALVFLGIFCTRGVFAMDVASASVPQSANSSPLSLQNEAWDFVRKAKQYYLGKGKQKMMISQESIFQRQLLLLEKYLN